MSLNVKTAGTPDIRIGSVRIAVPQQPGHEYIQDGLKYFDYGGPKIRFLQGTSSEGLLAVNPSTGMTTEFVMKIANRQYPDGTTDERDAFRFIDYLNGSGIGFFSATCNYSGDSRYFEFRIGDSNKWQTSSGGGIPWYTFNFSDGFHSVSVSQSINADGKFKLFVDGVKAYDITLTSSQAPPFSVSSFNRVGVFMAGDGTVNRESRSNNTILGCLRVYDRMLTDAEIAENYAIDVEKFDI